MPFANDVFWAVLQTGEVFAHAWGGPGTGKTRIIEAFNRALGRQMYTLIGSIREPADIGGYPYPTQCVAVKDPRTGKEINVYMALIPPKWALDCWDGQLWTVFMDETTTNSPPVQAAFMGVMTDRRVGDLPLPDSTWLCGAGNPPDSACNGHDLEGPMSNRMAHFNWDEDLDGWGDWLTSGDDGLPPKFTPLPADWRDQLLTNRFKARAFSKVRPSLMQKEPQERAQKGKAWPSKRTWTMAMTCLTAVEAIRGDEAMRYQAVSACVGDDAAHEFSKWEKTLDLPDPEKVLADVIAATKAGRKVNGEVPILERADQTLAFVGALCDRVLHHDLGRERWEAGLIVLDAQWECWKEVVLIGGKPMSDCWKAGWQMPSRFRTEALPLIRRAAMPEGVNS